MKLKKYDPNNFVIDYVFARIDKAYKKLAKKQENEAQEIIDGIFATNDEETTNTKTQPELNNNSDCYIDENGCYTIIINA